MDQSSIRIDHEKVDGTRHLKTEHLNTDKVVQTTIDRIAKTKWLPKMTYFLKIGPVFEWLKQDDSPFYAQ
jgi:hypothetical protein